ncbi:MAG: lamin tail domain-containing protein [Thermoanaerobaculia bacterium]|nr:lamin tail domain-containing protein [Thermoanaerobaculia bacterium]
MHSTASHRLATSTPSLLPAALAGAVCLAATLAACGGEPAQAQNPSLHVDGCDAGGASTDIHSLVATYDPDSDLIGVDMELCSPPDDRTKYRLRIDHEAPWFDDADRNGDGVVDGLDLCAETSDTGTMLHRGDRATGVAAIGVDGAVVRYAIAAGDLDPGLALGDRIFLWADTQNQGIGDRAPTPESADGCALPENAAEVVALDLVAPLTPILNEVVYDGVGSDGDEVFTEIFGPAGQSLDGWSLVGINGADGSVYRTVDLTGATIPADGLLVVAGSGALGAVAAAKDFEGSVDWQNGPDAVLLVDDEGAVADALQYGDAGAFNMGEGAPAPDVAGGSSLSRDGGHTDTDDNATDFTEGVPTPGV